MKTFLLLRVALKQICKKWDYIFGFRFQVNIFNLSDINLRKDAALFFTQYWTAVSTQC